MSDTCPLPGPHYQALLQLLRTSETVWNASRVFFTQWDLSPSQFNLLNLLTDVPEGLTQIELSRLLIMHRSNATGLINRLEARSLLARMPIPGDRRAHRVVLTPAGRALMKKVLPEYYRVAELIWREMPARRTQELVKGLSHLCSNIERTENELPKP